MIKRGHCYGVVLLLTANTLKVPALLILPSSIHQRYNVHSSKISALTCLLLKKDSDDNNFLHRLSLQFKGDSLQNEKNADTSQDVMLLENQVHQNVLHGDKMKVTIHALKQQLERQKADIKMTQQMIDRLERKETSDIATIDDENVSDFAASLMSGVDYGFLSRSEGAKLESIEGKLPGFGPPANLWKLGWGQFFRNLDAMVGEYKDEDNTELTPRQDRLQARLESLTLNSTAIWNRESKGGPITAPFIIKVPYLVLCWFLDVLFEGKYVPSRFFLLETVARMPYFSYITMLHLYETLGFWRRSADVKRIHFAEEINEYRHLLIMESLGGDQQWWVRFVAQHSAIVYFIVLCLLWAISPTLSYKFSELLETHAVNTYGQFLDENESELKDLPPSLAAIEYYSFGAADPFYGEFQTSALSSGGEIRRPGESMKNLYDVFQAIQADELDHVSTMQACLDEKVVLMSPSLEKRILTGIAISAATSLLLSGADISSINPTDVALDGSQGFEFDAIFGGAVGAITQIFGGSADVMVEEAKEAAVSMEAVEDTGLFAQLLGEGFFAGLLASKFMSSKKEKKDPSKALNENTNQTTTKDE